MSNSWDEMRKAKEEEYFSRRNREALERLASKKGEEPRKSPITGENMDRVAIEGVVVDRCPTSGGIWLDAGELEQLMDIARKKGPESGPTDSWITTFFQGLTKVK